MGRLVGNVAGDPGIWADLVFCGSSPQKISRPVADLLVSYFDLWSAGLPGPTFFLLGSLSGCVGIAGEDYDA